jgi:DNA (cytosine-5)-methyltransferase 1
MVNHPNRNKKTPSPARTPTPDEIRAGREAAGLTVTDAAEVILGTAQAWEAWEAGERRMHPGLWELFKIKTGLI